MRVFKRGSSGRRVGALYLRAVGVQATRRQWDGYAPPRPIAYCAFGWLTRSHRYRGEGASCESSMTSPERRQVGLLISFGAPTAGGAGSDRERLSVLGAFAAPREPSRCG